jgi:peptidoglycan hydrolase-like protein with peptidoglycan-binding domain
MRTLLAGVILFAFVVSLQADEAVANAQNILKDQGFYYGEVTGQKDAVTTDAIRRYQIRNGLQINGELNDETLRSLKNTASKGSSSSVAGGPSSAPESSATPDTSDLHVESGRGTPSDHSTPVPPNESSSPDQAPETVRPHDVVPSQSGIFAGTPYESSPTEVQRKVISDAQELLARRGLFRDRPDGFYGPSLEFSLRAYQARVGLRQTGRLDLETLAALELLPGAHTPVYTRRRGLPPPSLRPPVRGEWIRP